FSERCKGRWQYLCCRDRSIPDVQLAIFPASQRPDSFHRFISVVQQFAGFLQEKFSFCRQRHATRTAAQEVDANLVLQFMDVPAQGGLRNSKPRGGFGEVQCFTDCQKVSHPFQFNCHISLCRNGMIAQPTRHWANSKCRCKSFRRWTTGPLKNENKNKRKHM